ncbi:sensor histidine kinase [Nocardioides aequoreus]|uniref:sensor histidine kinase n=1 Tax=Nocardioides aequoreus TaxID=397278 RepID=UPI000691C94B|nr:ATP-binding protein [Nocardioides aequoreus]
MSSPPWLVVVLVLASGVAALVASSSLVAAVVAQLAVVGVCVPVVVWCRRAAVASDGRWASGWRLLTLAAVLFPAANLVTVVSVVLPDRGINSLIYPLQGGAMLAVLTALVVLPRPRRSRGLTLRTWLDVAVLVSSVALVGAVVLMGGELRSSAGADLVFALAYPTASLAMLAVAYELSRHHVQADRPELAFLTAAFAVWLVGATAYAALTPDAYVAPAPVSWTVGVGSLLLGLAARVAARPRGAGSELGERTARVVLAAPEASVVLAALTVVLGGLPLGPQRVLAAVVAAVVIARHLVVTSDARRFHWRLEREVAERTTELRRMTERYVRILDTVGDGIVSIGPSGRVIFVNAAARRLLVARDGELVGRDACEALCTPAPHDCPFEEVGRGRVLRGVDTELRRSDGGIVPVELSAAPELRDGQELPRGAVAAFRDVSDRIAVEQVKRQFVSSVSHELRTPLTSVRGVLEMFADGEAGDLSPVGRSLAANASRGVERLSRLVDDIIDAEKLATGEFRMQCSRVPLPRLLRDAAATLQPLAAGSGVSLVVEAPGSDVVWADPDRVEQALVNLVGNAVKFSPRGSAVTVGASALDGHAVVSVRDEGPGIPGDQLEHVFERFHQVTSGDATDRGGTGLGLTITRAIVAQHGGRVWVESAEGEGATFHFTLPLAGAHGVNGRPR